jgi:hypothetical protein
MWPPQWWISDQEAGEEGVLQGVRLFQDLTPECLYIAADYLGEVRKGIIILENPTHLRSLYRKLQENLGRPLAEIGNLELEWLPALRGPKTVRPGRPVPPAAAKKQA